jgi:hypothetical protein
MARLSLSRSHGSLTWLAPLALAAAWMTGVLARTWSLHLQVYSGDETHGVWSALYMPLSEILVTYRLADHCIPLAAFYRLLVRSGVGLSEVVLRAPSALAGIAATVLLPLLVHRWARSRDRLREGSSDAAAAARWAGLYCALLAISPSLIYYSRIARPYAVVALLAPLAAAAFWRWWRGGGARWAALWVAAGGLSAWFHLGTAPFVAVPLLWAAGDLVLARRRREAEAGNGAPGRPGWRGLLAAGAGLGLALAAFLVPAHESLLRLMRRKGAAAAGPDLAGLWDVARLHAGSAWQWVAILFWLAVAASFAAALRRGGRARAAAIYGATLVIGQWLAITLVLRPDGYKLPVVLARYLLPTLPVVLLALAWGLALLWSRLTERVPGRLWGAAAAVLAVAGLAAAGPYAAEPALRLGPFAGHPAAIHFLTPATRIPLDRVPAVYSLIAREAGEGAVLEITAGPAGMFQVPALAFWRVHRRPVIVAFDKEIAADPRLRLRTLAGLDPALMEASGARFVVLHLDLPRFRRLDRDGPESLAARQTTPPHHPGLARARRMGAELTAAWGEPDLVDGSEWVWDMARTGRSATGQSSIKPPGGGAE